MEQPTTSLTNDEKLFAMLCHVLSFSGYLVPFGNLLGPLIMWLIKKNESPFVDRHGKESVNFQISVLIYFIVSAVLFFVIIGFFLAAALFVFDIVVVIMAAIAANDGKEYRYPLCIRFIK
jgi:uncharacterized Tic20 family protein